MSSRTDTPPDSRNRVFEYEEFVHPSEQPGHIAFVLRVLDPRLYNQDPEPGLTFATIAFAQYAMPSGFHHLPIDEQALLYLDVTMPFWTESSSLVPVEEKGLKLISEEWTARYGHVGRSISDTHSFIVNEHFFGSPNQETGMHETATQIPDSAPTAGADSRNVAMQQGLPAAKPLPDNADERSFRPDVTGNQHNADQSRPNEHSGEQ